MVSLTENRACILAVGTELTTGQIVNRNAAWISAQLEALGIEVPMHLTVPDDRPAILEALRLCEHAGALLFVTGGLGPTSDDFTRDVIAQWAGEKLEWHEESWKHIEDRLTRFGIPVAPANRQQCYFPKSALVLHNPQGTANGFCQKVRGTVVWVLPGPPNEISAIWESSGIDRQIQQIAPTAQRRHLLTWQCMGKSEAELGEIVERALAGSSYQIGYRAHRPFVEVKVWVPETALPAFGPWKEKLEAAIGPWIFTRQGEDLAERLLNSMGRDEDIEILDAATGGLIAERLSPLLRSPEFADIAETLVIASEWQTMVTPCEWLGSALAQSDPEALTLAVAGVNARGEFAVGLREGGVVRQETLKSPWPNPEQIDRSRRYAVEMTIARWTEWLEKSVQ